MKTIAAVYTGLALVEPLKKVFAKYLPEYRLINMLDDGLIGAVMACGKVTPGITRRLINYYYSAVEAGADVILNTCSSVSEVVDLARPLLDIPILKIDEPMAMQAVQQAEKIGVIATLLTTLQPTTRLIEKEAAKMHKEVTLVPGLAEGAFEALVAGQPEKHDQLILETVQKLSDRVDVIVLAQGSMARMEQQLTTAVNKPVLSSPRLGVLAIKELFEK